MLYPGVLKMKNKNNMIDKENFPSEQDPTPGQEDENVSPENGMDLESQEQINNENIIQGIEDENRAPGTGNITTNETMGISTPLSGVTPGRAGEAKAIIDAEIEEHSDNHPTSKNLLGDNPPGAEDLAFNSDHPGDLNSDQVKYNAENIRENFRENIDKTSSEINLDRKLKEDENG